jgi:CcmD family protein
MPENSSFIVAAFAATWILLLGYAFRLHRARVTAERRLERLTQDATGSPR